MINADTVLHGDGYVASLTHSGDTVTHQRRLGHQAGTKAAVLHSVAGATAVEIDFVIPPSLTERRALGEVSRLGTAQLQRYGMLFVVKAQVALDIAMQNRAGGYHLGVDSGVARERAPEAPAVAVGPIHAGRSTEAPRVVTTLKRADLYAAMRAMCVEICHQVSPV